jgi:hypothetical protein
MSSPLALFLVASLVSASLKVPWCEEVVAIIEMRNVLVSLGCSRGIFFVSGFGHVVLQDGPGSSCTGDVVFLGKSIDTPSESSVNVDLQLGVGFPRDAER